MVSFAVVPRKGIKPSILLTNRYMITYVLVRKHLRSVLEVSPDRLLAPFYLNSTVTGINWTPGQMYKLGQESARRSL